MIIIKRLIYFFYYIKKTQWNKYCKFLNFATKQKGKSKLIMIIDSIWCVFKYNISFLEYFQFRFYEKSSKERGKWAGTGFMYEYQLKMNPKSTRMLLEDKRLFYITYKKFIKHQVYSLQEIKQNIKLAESILDNPSGKIVFKVYNGKCGKEVAIKNSSDFLPETLIQFLEKEGFDLVEEYIIQHPELMQLSPSGVNTVRIFTQLNKNNKVEILGCRLRISVGSNVDNLAAGNLAAPIDLKTGKISGPAVFSDITKQPEIKHPITNVRIPGFQIPFWEETVNMAIEAALLNKDNKSIGWDIAITKNGPDLIEGNHDWCKLLWQLPVNKGMKADLVKFLKEYEYE